MNTFSNGYTLGEILEAYKFPYTTTFQVSRVKNNYLLVINKQEQIEGDPDVELIRVLCCFDLSWDIISKYKLISSGILIDTAGKEITNLNDHLIFKITTNEGIEKIRLTKLKRVIFDNSKTPKPIDWLKGRGRMMMDLDCPLNPDEIEFNINIFSNKNNPVIDYELELQKRYSASMSIKEIFEKAKNDNFQKATSIYNDILYHFIEKNFSWSFIMPLYFEVNSIVSKCKRTLHNPNQSSPFLEYYFNLISFGEELQEIVINSKTNNESENLNFMYSKVIDFFSYYQDYNDAIERWLDYTPSDPWNRPDRTSENEYYNDDRDLDDQSQEFWDNV
jgi:hypothetical protein